MKTFFKILLLFIIASDIFILAGFSVFAFRVFTPLDPDSRDSELVVIEKGSSLQQIADQLRREGMIRSSHSFIVYVVLEGKTSVLQAGIYDLSPSMTVKEITDIISKGSITDYKKITIPEGYTSSQIASLLEDEGVLSHGQDLADFVNTPSQAAYQVYEYDFLKYADTSTLEGFLFPDTYEFHVNSSLGDVVDIFFYNFSQKTTGLFDNEALGQASNYSPYDILILASLLEKEVQTEEDMKLTAGVLYNRLEIGMPLQVDATLVYITGKKTGQITSSDKQIESPFNTYKYKGLPPAPISNPGLRAINAAMDPTPTDYIYYLSAPDGTTYFAVTLDEHNEN